MKKKILLLPLLALTLSGCSFEDLMFWKKKDDEQSEKEKEKESDPEKETDPEDPETIDPEDPDLQTYTATVSTSGADFATVFPTNTGFDVEAKQEALKEFFDNQLEYENLITSISCDNLHTLKFESETYWQFGSSSGTGSFTWNSDVKIYKVEATVLCYAKYDSYHEIYNIDSWSHFFIGDVEQDLTYDTEEGTKLPEEVTFSKSYSSGTKSFILASQYGRVFVKELKITWKG